MERERDRSNGFVNAISRSSFPSLDGYIYISVFIAAIASISVFSTFHSHPELHGILEAELRNMSNSMNIKGFDVDYLSSMKTVQIAHYVLCDSAMIWVAVNSYFAVLAICAKLLIRMTFKELSRQEEALARHAFFSYLLFSIVFLSVVTGAQRSHRVLPWLLWLGISGFISTVHYVIYQRFKVISSSSGPRSERISCLSMFMFMLSLAMTMCVLRIQSLLSWHSFALLAVDCLMALCRSSHSLLRCVSSSRIFASRPDRVRHFNYWLDLVVNLATDGLRLLNYAHLMLFSPGVNLTCVFFFYHIRLTYNCILEVLSRHQRHKRIFEHIERSYPLVKSVDDTDRCVVCWECLGESRRLPCTHQFHDWCLMWWLAQDSSCPTCRRVISSPHSYNGEGAGSVNAMPPSPQNTTFRFNGGGVSFFRLPAFSIEISTGIGPFFRRNVQTDESQLAVMADQVREMFPQMGMEAILEDLRMSGSAQATIENILEGRVMFGGVADISVDDSDDDSWHGDSDDASSRHADEQASIDGLASGDGGCAAFASLEEREDESYFVRERRLMIEKYRKRYIDSSKGADLRAKGITF
ncbi:unnamed protein product [Caenorhabditis auriculariae]|uniref:CUE domain-containing protein n=1 Tax=Caenorhabditis auriculariae TaxID=2777116 RepID=A0A8S1HQJ1_9PELO|nr:unnamed protein product [Caenorhabditis auriculariae]